ncbi:MAG: hypothetical protein QM756_12015 [Polyangiaceae bacterium]
MTSSKLITMRASRAVSRKILAEQQRFRRVVEAAYDVAVMGGAAHAAHVFAAPALAPTIERRHREARANPVELGRKVSAMARVAVKLQQRRATLRAVLGAQVLGVYARAADTREIEVEALGEARLQTRRDELDLGIGLLELLLGAPPIAVEVFRTRIPSGVGFQLGQRQIDQRHGRAA